MSLSDEESDAIHDGPAAFSTIRYPTARRLNRHKRYSSATLSNDTFSSLPEYPSTPDNSAPQPIKGSLLFSNPTLVTPEGHQWADHQTTPPPDYTSKSLINVGSPVRRRGVDTKSSSPGETDEERDVLIPEGPISPTLRSRKPQRKRRSYSAPPEDDRLDSLLERSIRALETSNALLQSSLNTHSSLSAFLSDSTFDRTMDAQIKFLSRRFGSADARNSELNGLIRNISGLIIDDEEDPYEDDDGGKYGGALSQSLPTGSGYMQPLSRRRSRRVVSADKPSSQQKLRLSADEPPRPVAPRPSTLYVNIESSSDFASGGTTPSTSPYTLYLPSTTGARSTNIFHISPPQAKASPSTSSQSTPALSLLSSIIDKPPSVPSSPSWNIFSKKERVSDSSTPSAPSTHRRTPSAPTSLQKSLHRSKSINTLSPKKNRSSSPSQPIPRLKLSSSQENLSTPSSTQPRREPVSAVKTVETLRKILAESSAKPSDVKNNMSAVAVGKQRAPGERPETLGTNSKPTALSISTSAPSLPLVYRGDYNSADALRPPKPYIPFEESISTPSTPPISPNTMRKSAMKRPGSPRSTPTSSGRSTPRVSFSELPPKHQSERPIKKSSSKSSKKPVTTEDDKNGSSWWSEWLLGGTVWGGDPHHPPTSTRRNPSGIGLMRDDASMARPWGSGMEHW